MITFCLRGILGWLPALLGLCDVLLCTGIYLLFLIYDVVKMKLWVFLNVGDSQDTYYIKVNALVFLGCCIRIPQTGWLKPYMLIYQSFEGWEVPDQGAGRYEFWWGPSSTKGFMHNEVMHFHIPTALCSEAFSSYVHTDRDNSLCFR